MHQLASPLAGIVSQELAVADRRAVARRERGLVAAEFVRDPGHAGEVVIRKQLDRGTSAPVEHADEAVVLFVREESGELELEVAGPKREHVVEDPGESQLLLDAPGFTVVDGPDGSEALSPSPA